MFVVFSRVSLHCAASTQTHTYTHIPSHYPRASAVSISAFLRLALSFSRSRRFVGQHGPARPSWCFSARASAVINRILAYVRADPPPLLPQLSQRYGDSLLAHAMSIMLRDFAAAEAKGSKDSSPQVRQWRPLSTTRPLSLSSANAPRLVFPLVQLQLMASCLKQAGRQPALSGALASSFEKLHKIEVRAQSVLRGGAAGLCTPRWREGPKNEIETRRRPVTDAQPVHVPLLPTPAPASHRCQPRFFLALRGPPSCVLWRRYVAAPRLVHPLQPSPR